jgi:3-dehydroquinate dehydratase-2
VLNGANLILFGTREPEIYGSETLADIEQQLQQQAQQANIELAFHQSNAEHELIEMIQQARGNTDFIIINPAAFTHTSAAIRDALKAVDIPFIELHISNIHQREAFRQHSYFSDVAVGVICGLGTMGYSLALEAAIQRVTP